jgi:hypothetical protein
MVEVGGSNPPGPTKRETLAIGGVFRLRVQLARNAEGGRQITTKGVI